VAATNGRAATRLALFAALERAPWSFDFFQALRRIEGVSAEKPRLGKALRPVDEPVRLSQEASMAFAPSTLSVFEEQQGGLPPGSSSASSASWGPMAPCRCI
jgi:type VI secretion system protein ImpH